MPKAGHLPTKSGGLQGSCRSLKKSYIDLSIFKFLKSLKNGNFSVEGLKMVLNWI